MNLQPQTVVDAWCGYFNSALLPVATAILFFVTPIKAVAAQFVAVTADFVCTSRVQYSGGHVETNQWKHAAKCIVGTNIWCIQIDFSNHPQIKGYSETSTYVFTGTNLIQRSRSSLDSSGKEWVKKHDSFGNGVGEIGQGNLSWLAFCSGPYFRGKGRAVPLPYSSATFPQVANTATATTFSDELGLPGEVTFLAADGFPLCHYRVLESTNLLGWTFPLRFQFTQSAGPGGGDGVPRWDKAGLFVEGQLTSIQAGKEPEIPAGTP